MMTLLDTLRLEIDGVNRELISLLGKRIRIAREIARLKRAADLPLLDAGREESILIEMRSLAKEHKLSPPVVEELFQMVLDYTRLEMESI